MLDYKSTQSLYATIPKNYVRTYSEILRNSTKTVHFMFAKHWYCFMLEKIGTHLGHIYRPIPSFHMKVRG